MNTMLVGAGRWPRAVARVGPELEGVRSEQAPRLRVRGDGALTASASSAVARGIELVFLTLVDGIDPITPAVGADVSQGERDDDDDDDPQGMNGKPQEPENQRGQDYDHHSAEASPLAQQNGNPALRT